MDNHLLDVATEQFRNQYHVVTIQLQGGTAEYYSNPKDVYIYAEDAGNDGITTSIEELEKLVATLKHIRDQLDGTKSIVSS